MILQNSGTEAQLLLSQCPELLFSPPQEPGSLCGADAV